jgi:Flp pilus assembly protein TadG
MRDNVRPSHTCANHARGVVAVEFALAFVAFLPFFLGAFEIARFAYLRNVALEASRIGARTVALCDPNDATNALAISRMRTLLPQLPDGSSAYVTISRVKSDLSTACSSSADCAYVSVSINALPIETVIPLVSVTLSLPTVSTTIPREYMVSAGNSACS